MDDDELEHYLSGYRWIRVRRHIERPELSWEARYRRLETHHRAETDFLIAEVRRLARRLHALSGSSEAAESPPAPPSGDPAP